MRKRSRARVVALQFLFQHEGGTLGEREAYAKSVHREAKDPDVEKFALELIDGCLEHWDALSSRIGAVSENWTLERMSSSDRNVLRLAVFELLHRDDIPPRATLNEAIELAKRFGAEQSGSFVNGILDKILNQTRKDEQ